MSMINVALVRHEMERCLQRKQFLEALELVTTNLSKGREGSQAAAERGKMLGEIALAAMAENDLDVVWQIRAGHHDEIEEATLEKIEARLDAAFEAALDDGPDAHSSDWDDMRTPPRASAHRLLN